MIKLLPIFTAKYLQTDMTVNTISVTLTTICDSLHISL